MDEIVESVRRVSDLIAAMAQASREQSLGIQQVSQTVVQLEQVTQQNAAVVQQVAASAESMKNQARDLLQSVSAFRVGANEQALAVEALQPSPKALQAAQPPRAMAGAAQLATPVRPVLGASNKSARKASDQVPDEQDDWQEF
jgi:hypothetical protein